MSNRRINYIGVALAALFVVIVLVAAIASFFTVQYVVKTMQTFKLPGVVINENQPNAQPAAAGDLPPVTATVVPAAPAVDAPPPWDGASRVNILALGLDARDWMQSEGPPRSDSMMLVSIDPLTKSAAMLSIPRDLWVNVPGFTYGRINTAYMLGEGSKLPGGGPALAAKTVEALIGVPIHYYAQIDFQAFVDFIDAIGGVKVEVKETIKIDMLGNEPLITNKKAGKREMGDKTVKPLKPGVWNMDGRMALAYARERHTSGGDFDRAMRQQQVFMAVRDRMLEFEYYGMLLTDMPGIYQKLSSGIHTNMSFDEAFRLGLSAIDIPVEKIKRGVLDKNYVTFAKSPDGTQDVLKIRPQEMRTLRDQLFTDGQTVSQIAAAGLEYAVQAEHARIAVQNGVPGSDLATPAAQYLSGLGLTVVQGGVEEQTSSSTMLVDYTGNPYTLRYLQQLLSVNANMVRNKYDPNSQVDVAIVVGNDWRQP